MPAASWNQSPEDLDDFEYPDPDDVDDETTDTITCPECKADVYDDADQCPVCGHFLIPDTQIWQDKPVWWILLAVLGIAAVILTLLFSP